MRTRTRIFAVFFVAVVSVFAFLAVRVTRVHDEQPFFPGADIGSFYAPFIGKHVVMSVLPFLGVELPLKVVSVTPSTDTARIDADKTDPVIISGRQPLTVVFSRAVIALGSDFDADGSAAGQVPFLLTQKIPGKLRWVTTYIARFDPDVDWPNDLAFELVVNPKLETYNGLQVSNPIARKYITPNLDMALDTVNSELAMNATDGLWDPFTSPGDMSGPEVPPDGRISLSFSHAVDLDLLRKHLVVLSPSGQRVPSTIEPSSSPCSGRFGGYNPYGGYGYASPQQQGAPTCLTLVPEAYSLQPATAYRVRLPAGSKVHPYAGPTTRDTELLVTGLRPFTIPFLQTASNYLRPQFRRYHLWLRHGLKAVPGTKDEESVLSSLSSAISISPPMSFTLSRIAKAKLQLEGPFNPNVEYTIKVSPSPAVLDSFNLPLLGTSTFFTTMEAQNFFVEPNGHVTFDRFDEAFGGGKWHVMTRGSRLLVNGVAHKVTAGPVTQPSAVQDALRTLFTDRSVYIPETATIAAPLTDSFQLAQNSAGEAGIDMASQLQDTGLFLRHRWDREGWDCATYPCKQYPAKESSFVSVSEVGVTFLASGASEIVAWVTRHDDGSNVEGAQVEVLSYSYESQQVSSLTKNTTLADGTTLLLFPDLCVATNWGRQCNYGALFAVVEYGDGKLATYHDFAAPWSGTAASVTASMVTDRKLYKEEDSVLVKGYVRALSFAGELSVPAHRGYVLHVQWNPDQPSSMVSVPVEIDATYGSFDANLTIPKDAKYGDVSIYLYANSSTNAEASRHHAAAFPSTTSSSVPVSISAVHPMRPPVGVTMSNLPMAVPVPPPDIQGEIVAQPAVSSASVLPETSSEGSAGAAPGDVSSEGSVEPSTGDVRTDIHSHSREAVHAAAEAEPASQADSPEASSAASSSDSSSSAKPIGLKVHNKTLRKLHTIRDTPCGNGPCGKGRSGKLSRMGRPKGMPRGDAVADVPQFAKVKVSGPMGGSPSDIIASTLITIADPRIPTVVLDVTTTVSSYKPGSKLPFTVTTMTYSGTPVSSAEVTIRWSVGAYRPDTMFFYAAPGTRTAPSGVISVSGNHLVLPFIMPRLPYLPPPPEEAGLLTLSSDAAGKITHELDFESALNRPLNPHDTVSVEVTWIGPTREQLKKSISVTVAPSEWELSLVPSISDPIPGFDFVLFTKVNNFITGANVPNVPVTVSLFQWDGSTPATDLDPKVSGDTIIPGFTDKSPVATCSVTTSADPSALDCTLRLPSAEKYVAIARATDPNGYIISAAYPLGRTPQQWRERPLGSFGLMHITSDKAQYRLGDVAKFTFHNPFLGGARVLARWGNRLQKQQFQDTLDAGVNVVEVPISGECSGGCTLALAVITPRNHGAAYRENLLAAGVPISPLFDVDLPRAVSVVQSVSVDMEKKSLAVEIVPANAIVAPSTQTSLTINVRTSDGQPTAAEICVWAVDSALLDLKPYPLPHLNESFSVSLNEAIAVSDSRSRLVSALGYNYSINVHQRRVALDPWVMPSWPLSPNSWYGSSESVEVPDDLYLPSLYTQITEFPASYFYTQGPSYSARGGMMGRSGVTMALSKNMMMADRSVAFEAAPVMTMAMAAPMLADAGAALEMAPPPGAAGGPGGVTVPPRTNFQRTALALHRVVVPVSGAVTLPFPLPDNIGEYTIRAYAVDGSHGFGSGEATLTVRKELNLMPSVPRIVRKGDKFECGATISMADPSFSGSVQVEGKVVVESGAQCVVMTSTTSSYSVEIDASQVKEFKFAFEAQVLGEATFVFGAKSGSVQDSLQAIVPVYPIQEPLLVATSMAIQANALGTPWSEGIELPEAEPGSGSVRVEASVGRLAAVEAMALTLVSPAESTADHLLGILAAKASLLPYYSSGTASNTLILATQGADSAMQQLQQLTNYGQGLRWRVDPWTRDEGWYIDTYLNTWAVIIANQLHNNAVDLDLGMVQQWRAAIERGLIQQANDARRWGSRFEDFSAVAYARLALGYHWQPAADWQTVQDLSVDRLVENIDRCADGAKAAIALAALPIADEKAHMVVQSVVEYLLSNVRVQGRTAYLSASKASALAASMSDNALATLILLHGGASENPLVEKIANFIAKGSSRGSCLWYPSSIQVSMSALALSNYDQVRRSTAASLDFKVTSGSSKLMDVHFEGSSTDLKSAEVGWETLADPPQDLRFVAKGTGEVSVAAMLNFVPAKVYDYPLYRGIYVERIIQVVDALSNKPTGPPIGACQVGSIVAVTIQVTMPDQATRVEVVDLVPGGLEPVDPNVDPFATFETGWVFNSREVKKDKVRVSGTGVWAGTHSVVYQAVAATTGFFVLPSARAYDASQPELMGLAAGGFFNVTEGPVPPTEAAAQALYAKASMNLRNCPELCSRRGECNLSTGKCRCDPGYDGPACADITPVEP